MSAQERIVEALNLADELASWGRGRKGHHAYEFSLGTRGAEMIRALVEEIEPEEGP